jgi:hypothetical protein
MLLIIVWLSSIAIAGSGHSSIIIGSLKNGFGKKRQKNPAHLAADTTNNCCREATPEISQTRECLDRGAKPVRPEGTAEAVSLRDQIPQIIVVCLIGETLESLGLAFISLDFREIIGLSADYCSQLRAITPSH